MKKYFFILTLFFIDLSIFAANNYDEIFAPLKEIQNILKYVGASILVLSLIAQGIIIFFSDNIPDTVKKTVGKITVGGIFIGGASAISSYILPNSTALLLFFIF